MAFRRFTSLVLCLSIFASGPLSVKSRADEDPAAACAQLRDNRDFDGASRCYKKIEDSKTAKQQLKETATVFGVGMACIVGIGVIIFRSMGSVASGVIAVPKAVLDSARNTGPEALLDSSAISNDPMKSEDRSGAVQKAAPRFQPSSTVAS